MVFRKTRYDHLQLQLAEALRWPLHEVSWRQMVCITAAWWVYSLSEGVKTRCWWVGDLGICLRRGDKQTIDDGRTRCPGSQLGAKLLNGHTGRQPTHRWSVHVSFISPACSITAQICTTRRCRSSQQEADAVH